MYVKISYDDEFVDQYMYLKSKHPKELFNLEGIGEQLDIGKFSRNFFLSKSVADVSVDTNSNVDEQTVKAYESELPKPYFRLNSIYLIWKYLRRLYNTEVANEFFERQLTGEIYVNDLHGVNSPYCFNFSTYDIMVQGLPFVTKIESKPPKHLSSFIGQLIHFTVYASNSTLGAVGLADLLIVASYYVDKMFKDNPTVPKSYLWTQVKQELQSFIFSCNQPFRGGIQSGFYNISLYDDKFLGKLCDEYVMPDGEHPSMELIKKLQEMYLDLMNETLQHTPVTFPVTTACFATNDDSTIQDIKFLKMIAKKNQAFGFINIYAGKTSTLSSCCRLRSDTDNEYFNSFGAGGTKIGSLGVVTVNIPRLAIRANKDHEKFFKLLRDRIDLAIRINNVKRHILQRRIDDGRAPLYDKEFMVLSRQYSTVGVIGFNEVCDFMDLDILTEEGQDFVGKILDEINNLNDIASKKYSSPHNCEQVPAENSAIKMAKKDQLLKYQHKYDIYSNQFIPLIANADLLDRIKLQGMFDSKMSGGAIAHLNVETQISDPKLIEELIKTAIKCGVIYHAINYNLQRCENGHMSVGHNEKCSICAALITDNFTRVVGFLTNVKNWHKVRREQDYPERKWYNGKMVD